MKKSDFFYVLPEELIAQEPLAPRDSSRLLVFDRQNGEISDRVFSDILDYLRAGDLLVINNTKVIKARLFGRKPSGAKIEILLHKKEQDDVWIALAKPAKRLKEGTSVIFSDSISLEVQNILEDGNVRVRFIYKGDFGEILDSIGETPLPHYIRSRASDSSQYQTVYAKTSGSCAAPTAGLHFTSELLEGIKAKGVEIAEVLLEVGLGTFRPVKTDNITEHVMHSEFFEIDEVNADKINRAKSEGRRVIAVGTTSVRVLESAAKNGKIAAKSGETDIFIYPPYRFKIVDALITNFHLPESTLIMLVSAFCGHKETMNIYDYAVKNKYRFFSFGDAMLLL